MIIPKEEELWQDGNGYKFMPFLINGVISFVGKYGNFFDFGRVVHGENGWERLWPIVKEVE